MRDITVGQLREMLEDLPDDMPIRVVEQPSYPLQLSIWDSVARRQGVAYLRISEHPYNASPYMPKAIFEEDDDNTGDDLPCEICHEPTGYVVDDAEDPTPCCTRCAARDNIEIIDAEAQLTR
jgi:hypothetical protein